MMVGGYRKYVGGNKYVNKIVSEKVIEEGYKSDDYE